MPLWSPSAISSQSPAHIPQPCTSPQSARLILSIAANMTGFRSEPPDTIRHQHYRPPAPVEHVLSAFGQEVGSDFLIVIRPSRRRFGMAPVYVLIHEVVLKPHRPTRTVWNQAGGAHLKDATAAGARPCHARHQPKQHDGNQQQPSRRAQGEPGATVFRHPRRRLWLAQKPDACTYQIDSSHTSPLMFCVAIGWPGPWLTTRPSLIRAGRRRRFLNVLWIAQIKARRSGGGGLGASPMREENRMTKS